METPVATQADMTTKVVGAKTFFYSEGSTSLNEIHAYVNKHIEALYAELERSGLKATGPLEMIYFGATADMNKPFTLQFALPVEAEKPVSKEFKFKQAAPFHCLSYDYTGDVSQMYPAYDMLYQLIGAQHLQPADEIREVYKVWEHLTSPNNITEIQIGLK